MGEGGILGKEGGSGGVGGGGVNGVEGGVNGAHRFASPLQQITAAVRALETTSQSPRVRLSPHGPVDN